MMKRARLALRMRQSAAAHEEKLEATELSNASGDAPEHYLDPADCSLGQNPVHELRRRLFHALEEAMLAEDAETTCLHVEEAIHCVKALSSAAD